MRIILKPLGAGTVLLTIIGLVTLLVLSGRKPSQSTPVAPPTPAVPLSPTALEDAIHAGTAVSLIEYRDSPGEVGRTWHFSRSEYKLVQEKTPGANQYLRVVVTAPEKDPKPWSSLAIHGFNKPLKKGDRLEFRGWLRSPESLPVHAYIEPATNSNPKSLSLQMVLGPQWKEYRSVGTVREDYAGGEARFVLHLGYLPGTVEMSGFRLYTYPQPGPIPEGATTPSQIER